MPPASRDDPRTDLELVAAIERGDTAAFEALYRRYRDWVVRLARRFTQDDDLALDVLQEVFLYLLGRFPGFRLRARMTTFLYPAVKNLSLRHRSRSQRAQGSLEDAAEIAAPASGALFTGAPASGATSGQLAAGGLAGDAIARVVALLPAAHAEVLLMRFVDDMALAEIAAALDVPLGTVKSRLHNALAALRQDPRTRELFE